MQCPMRACGIACARRRSAAPRPCAACLAACLAAIVSDPDIVLCRIKNRLWPDGGGASASAGFRNVAVNLRLATAAAVALGVETHVCEVQLVLRAVAELKSAAGHRNYVTFRNLRVE